MFSTITPCVSELSLKNVRTRGSDLEKQQVLFINSSLAFYGTVIYSTNPQYMAYRTHGLARTLKQLLTLSQPRVGTLVGVDAHGNEYYENRQDINCKVCKLTVSSRPMGFVCQMEL